MASRSAITSHKVWETNQALRASNRTPDRSSGRPEAGTSCGRPRATSGNRITRMASNIHGRIDQGIHKFDRRIWRGFTTSSNFSFRASSSKTYLKQIRRNAHFFSSFSERPELRNMQTHESYEGAMYKKSWRSDGQNYDCRKIWVYDKSRPQGSIWRKGIWTIDAEKS